MMWVCCTLHVTGSSLAGSSATPALSTISAPLGTELLPARPSLHARWHEDMQRPAQTFKECWDALPPLRPVPGRTRSLQLPVYRRWPFHVEAVTKVRVTWSTSSCMLPKADCYCWDHHRSEKRRVRHTLESREVLTLYTVFVNLCRQMTALSWQGAWETALTAQTHCH